VRLRAGGVLGVGLSVLLLLCAGLRGVGLVGVCAMPVVKGYLRVQLTPILARAWSLSLRVGGRSEEASCEVGIGRVC
jgi:hypothetical protein